jgi:ERCC4-type nuclease
MASRVTILVDHGERASGVPAHLRCLGVNVEYRSLRVGDYVIGSAAVERKSIADLHRSIASGRIWRQIGAMRSTFGESYLLLEGQALYDGPLSPAGVRGAVLAIAEGDVRVVWAQGSRDAAQWISTIASRAVGVRPQKSRARSRAVRSPASMLALVPGVSPATAAELLRRFGSVAAVALADDRDLLAVRGLGPARLATLKSLLA